MSPVFLAFLLALGFLVCCVVADEHAKRKNRRASEALNQRHRVGL